MTACLCQDCLRVHELDPLIVEIADNEREYGNRLCPCGGDVCPCPSCQAAIPHLEAGDFANAGLMDHADITSWSRESGVGTSRSRLRLSDRLIAWVTRRHADFVIGQPHDPYLLRWFVIPRNRFLNVYLHRFVRSDDDRALHDHPWSNLSILLRGRYVEHTIDAGGIHRRREFQAGDWKLRPSGKFAHRIELVQGSCWTLFITGPRYRAWGFHCPEQGWIPWQKFTAPHDEGQIGKGCDA